MQQARHTDLPPSGAGAPAALLEAEGRMTFKRGDRVRIRGGPEEEH
jgi:hypothetical protein